MELSSEDNLRLNVLVKQKLQAVKIDDSRMTVHALTDRGEAKITLNPTCRDDKYLRMVREMFSTHALGSPGGYPVYLRRWTRMGQMREESLQGLLLLGEPEAVVAVANSPQLSEEIAKRVWWAMPEADIARRMLSKPHIAQSETGKELAAYLIDYLPFETEAQFIVDTVRLVLQPGLIDPDIRNSLWVRAARKTAFYVGFLLADPDTLPEQLPASGKYKHAVEQLSEINDNIYAQTIIKLLSGPGQTFLVTVEKAMHKLADQQVTVLMFKALQNYFRATAKHTLPAYRHFDAINTAVQHEINSSHDKGIVNLLGAFPDYLGFVEAILCLSCVSESLLDPIFSQTDAVGTVMRKRLIPVTQAISAYISRFLQ